MRVFCKTSFLFLRVESQVAFDIYTIPLNLMAILKAVSLIWVLTDFEELVCSFKEQGSES